MKSDISIQRRWAGAALLACAASLLSLPAMAENLDAKSARNLISGHMWAIKSSISSSPHHWTWNADGTVCTRIYEKTGPCVDTGTWRLEGARMCFQLTWWGSDSGFQFGCYRITDLGKARYGALQDNGLTFFEFTVVK